MCRATDNCLLLSRQIVYAIQDCATLPNSIIPNIKKLREKYTFNIYPCGLLEPEGVEGDLHESGGRDAMMCPPPSRGGSFLWKPKEKKDARTKKEKRKKEECEKNIEGKVLKDIVVKESLVDEVEGGESGSRRLEEFPIETQIKLLTEHYSHIARQPSSIKCSLGLTIPRARALCPQMKRTVDSSPGTVVYAADVPPEVLHQSQILGGFSTLQFLRKQRSKTFTICCPQPINDSLLGGVELMTEEQRLHEAVHEAFSGHVERKGSSQKSLHHHH